MRTSTTYLYRFLVLLLFLSTWNVCFAQNNLNKQVSINANQKKLADLLTEVGRQGNFYFSYNSDMFPNDSVVSLTVANRSVRQLLDQLFNHAVDYKETPGYIILRPAPYRLTLVPENTEEPENTVIISGHVADEVTGKRLANASVFERHLLVSTLTDKNGHFKLKLKTTGSISLTVSKAYYHDTTVTFLSKINVSQKTAENYVYTPQASNSRAERHWLSRAFVSSKLKIQSFNIGGYISGVPVQTSVIPGVGSHGLMSGQIVNHFSLNVFGGYSAGVDGLEIGGLGNIDKGDVKYVQVAGLINVVGGNTRGVQVAGLHNGVLKKMYGVQIAGLTNKVDDSVSGVQVAGLVNLNNKTAAGLQVAGLLNGARQFNGMQVAGLANINVKDATGFQLAGLVNGGRNIKGMQVAGLANIAGKSLSGFHVAGLFNGAHKLSGVNIALINVADTLEGHAINLFSVSSNGYHQLGFFTDENYTAYLHFKTGNKTLYSKLIGGVNFSNAEPYYAYGLALGHDFSLSKSSLLSTEFSTQFLNAPKWNNVHQLHRFSLLADLPLTSKLRLFFGPSVSFFDLGNNNTRNEEQAVIRNKIGYTGIGSNFKLWAGWNIGLSIF